jgi:hypothetical protein
MADVLKLALLKEQVSEPKTLTIPEKKAAHNA